MGRSAAPSNHGAAAPQRHAQALGHWTFGRCRRFARLGGRNERGRKIEGDARALKWPPFYKFTHNNQLKVGDDDEGEVGENAWLGRNEQGGCRVVG